jgi:hypothetical protein
MNTNQNIEIIQSITELLRLHDEILKRNQGVLLDDETMQLMKSTLKKCLKYIK